MATSVVPAVMVALKTLLDAEPGLDGVDVHDGLPGDSRKDLVVILGADPHEQTTAGMRAAPHPREERFVLHTLISVIRKGDKTHVPVTARAFELAAVLEDVLRVDPTIGGSLGNGWATVTGLPLQKEGPDNDGVRGAAITAQITCRARI